MIYDIFIPSYKRSKILQSHTLDLLHRYNIPKNYISIFVETSEMKDDYIKILGTDYHIVVSDTKGIMWKRNFMEMYAKQKSLILKRNLNVVYIDDDIKGILDYDKQLDDIDLLIKLGFRECIERKLYIWGVSLFTNPFFLQKKISTTNKYICAGLFGMVYTGNKKPILVTVGHGEDYERSMKTFLRDGGVIRFNWIALQTKNFNKSGGIIESLGSEEARKKESEINMKQLANQYKGMCKLVYKKHIGYYDLRLNSFFSLPKME
tara:strand:+ start:423 stop:1211 length:789 start_codon:yes stop_codon:yes gene_type:complete